MSKLERLVESMNEQDKQAMEILLEQGFDSEMVSDSQRERLATLIEAVLEAGG